MEIPQEDKPKKRATAKKKSPVTLLEEVLKQLEEGSLPYKYVVKAIEHLKG